MVQNKLCFLRVYQKLAVPHPGSHSMHSHSSSDLCSEQKSESFEVIWRLSTNRKNFEKIHGQGSASNPDCHHFCHESILRLDSTSLWCKIYLIQLNSDSNKNLSSFMLGLPALKDWKLETFSKHCLFWEAWFTLSTCLPISLCTSTCYGEKRGLWGNQMSRILLFMLVQLSNEINKILNQTELSRK